jgi:hypothetical protein
MEPNLVIVILALGVLCGVVASVMQFMMLAQLNATRPAEQRIRWYATGDFGTGWSVWKEHQRVFPDGAQRRWMVTLWLVFAVCVIVAAALNWLA